MSRKGRSTAVDGLVALVVALGAAGAASMLWIRRAEGFGDLRVLVLCTAALGVLSAFPIVMEWRGESENVNLEEAIFAVLVMTSPAPAVMVSLLAATLFHNVYHRIPPLKLAFNVGLFAFSGSVAIAVSRSIGGTVPTGPGWRGALAAAAGVLTLYTVTTLGVRAVVAVVDGLSFRSLFAGTNAMELVIITSSSSLGMLAGTATSAAPLAVLLVFPPLAVVVFVVHQHARAVRDRKQLDRLLETAVTANSLSGAEGVRGLLIEAASHLLHTTQVTIQLAPPGPGQLGSALDMEDSRLWLVAQPRVRTRTNHSGTSLAEAQALLDGIAAIGAAALSSADLLERVRHQAFHDSLTGLANRLLFEDRVGQALRGRDHPKVGLLFVDLDRFKRVNDSLGHGAGDLLLTEVAERLQGAIRSCDSAARVGGDEFAILLPDIDEEQDALEIATRITTAMRAPFTVSGAEVVVTASVGVALAPWDGADYESLLRAADLAMYDAKAAGRDSVQRAHAHGHRRGGLGRETDLRHALDRGQLWVAYQPQIDLATRRIVGTEALIRWTHPERGLLPPDSFLPLAEELGLMSTLDTWVLETACAQTAHWRTQGAPHLRVAVNLSDAPLRSPSLSEHIRATLERTGLPAAALELEVTERVASMDSDATLTTLSELRALGIRIAIDDFGTGYSSLSRLRTLPADIIKIDRSFVREITAPTSAVPLVTSTITMAHALGLQVVAEGIETPAQLAFLSAHGCETGQGYLLGRPVAAAELHPQQPLEVPRARTSTNALLA